MTSLSKSVVASIMAHLWDLQWERSNHQPWRHRRFFRRLPSRRHRRVKPCAALNVATGQFAATTSGATTTVSTSFQGKALILFGTAQTANGSDTTSNAMFSIGFSDGTNHCCMAWCSDDNVDPTNAGRTFRTDSAHEILTAGTPTSVRRVTGVAFNSGDFTLTWDGTPAAAYRVGYVLVGGTDITNVQVGSTAMSTSTGTQTISTVGFQGSFAMFLASMMTAAGTATRANGGIGFATGSSNEFSCSWGIDDGASMTTTIDSVGYVNQAASLSGITLGAETVEFLADFTGFTSNGFTLNISNAPASAWLFAHLVIAGGQWTANSRASETVTTQTQTGVAFQPTLGFWVNTDQTADNTVAANCAIGVGTATSTSTEVAAGASQADLILNTAVKMFNDGTKASAKPAGGGSAPTYADFTSFNSDGWTLTWPASTAVPIEGWFACAADAVTNIGKRPLAALLAHRRFYMVP